jgi:hypothetical protein
MLRLSCAAALISVVIAGGLQAQSNILFGDPVIVNGKLGVGTSTPAQKVDVRTPGVWDGIQITGTEVNGAGAFFGMRSPGGVNGFLDLFLDARYGENAVKFETNLAYFHFTSKKGTPFTAMAINNVNGDLMVRGEVTANGIKLGPPGAVLQGPAGPQGPIGPQGPVGPPGGVVSLNGMAGAMKVVGGTNTSVASVNGTITISATPGKSFGACQSNVVGYVPSCGCSRTLSSVPIASGSTCNVTADTGSCSAVSMVASTGTTGTRGLCCVCAQ